MTRLKLRRIIKDRIYDTSTAEFLAAASLAMILSGCLNQAALDRADQQAAWRSLPPEGRATIVRQACDPDRTISRVYTVTSCPSRTISSFPGKATCTEVQIRPPMTPFELAADTKATVAATCRQLNEVASRGGVTHQAWCASDVPKMLPQGVALDQAEAQAVTCYTTTLRRLSDTANQRRDRCCANREQIGSNGVWKCLQDEVDKLDMQRADDMCKTALGGSQPYGAALWCGICANPEAFLMQLRKDDTTARKEEGVVR